MELVTPGAPGLYLQGVQGPSVPPVGSAITGFVGVARRGPINRPQALDSWSDFESVFGGRYEPSHLGDAVFGFFLNGGERCWVVRVADDRDRSAENPTGKCPRVDLLRKAEDEAVDDPAGDPTLRVEAINEGAWGNGISYRVDHRGTGTVSLTELTAAAETLATQIHAASVLDITPGSTIQISHRDNPFIKRSYEVGSADPATGQVDLTTALGVDFPPGSIVSGRGFRLTVRCGDLQEVFDDLSMTSEHENFFLHRINGEPSQQQYVERQRNGHSILIRVEPADPATAEKRFKPADTSGERALSAGGDGFTQAHVSLNDASEAPSVEVFAAISDEASGISGNALRVEATPFRRGSALAIPDPADGARGRIVIADGHLLKAGQTVTVAHPTNPGAFEGRTIVSADAANVLFLDSPLANDYPIGSVITAEERFDVSVWRGDELEPVERFFNLSVNPATGESFFAEAINGVSEYVCMEEASTPPGTSIAPPEGTGLLKHGEDPGSIDYRYYTGYDSNGEWFVAAQNLTGEPVGMAALEAIDEPSLMAIPDASRASQGNLSSQEEVLVEVHRHQLHHCLLTGDRLALVDGPEDGDAEQMALWPENFNEGPLSRFGALYHPWLVALFPDGERRIPPSGHVAGAIALSDRRNGVQRAPANIEVIGVVDVAEKIAREQHQELNQRGINCVRRTQAGAFRILGARTLSREPEHRYVNVRRLLLAVIKGLSRNLLWIVFEPNTPSLRKRVQASISSYLSTLVVRGATAGRRTSEAFYVKCNEETNTEETVDSGQLIAEIGLALATPAEFIIIKARRTAESRLLIQEAT